MSSKAEREHVKKPIRVAFHAARAVLLVLVVIAALFATAETAGAQVTKMLIFTDKKVYKEWYTDMGKTSGNTIIIKGQSTDNLAMIVYAILLDQDGNIVYGAEGGLGGTIDDVKELDHFHLGDASTHHKIANSNPGFLTTNTVLKFVDDGSVVGDVAADGVYTAFQDIDDPSGSLLLDDHLLVNVTVTYGSLSEVYQVLITNQNCHQGETPSHNQHTNAADGSSMDPCTFCHIGYEHMYENKSGTYGVLDVHFGKMKPPTVTYSEADISFIWNKSTIDRATYSQTTAGWENQFPGSSYCYACHYASGGTGNLYDYGAGDRSNIQDTPSCNVASKTLGAGTVTCHATTNITGTSIPAWSPPAGVGPTNAETRNPNASRAKGHAYDGSGVWNVPCAACHDTSHSLVMPNANPANYTDISEQCESCHAAYEKHNNTINCIKCHGSDQHNITYLWNDTTYKWNDTNAVQCSDCHENATFAQQVGVNPVIVPPTKHSADIKAGQKWGKFWTSEEQDEAAGGAKLINWSQKAVYSETALNSTTTGVANAQTVNDIFEQLIEGWRVVPPVDNYAYVSSTSAALGTVLNLSFMQNASDGKNATLREGIQTIIIVRPNATSASDTTTDTLSGILYDDSVTENPDTLSAVGTTDNVYTVDAGKVMFLDKFNTSKIPSGATITGVTLHLEYGIEDGYSPATASVRWSRQGGALNSTGIIPDETVLTSGWSGDTTYDLYAQGINTVSQIADLNIEFTSSDGSGADAIHFDYVWLEITYTGGNPKYYEMDIQANMVVPYADKSFLEIRYYRDTNDTYDLYVYNGTAWNDRGNLTNTTMSVLNYTLTNEEYNNGGIENNNGNVNLMFVDKNQTPNGTLQGNLYIDYIRVHYLLGNTTHYETDVRHNLTDLLTEKNTKYYFTIRGYKGSGDNVDIKLWDYDHENWRTYGISKFKETTDWYNVSIAETSVDSTGKAIIRYVDSNQSRYDTVQDSVYVDYSGIRSETYAFLPCRYCHAINKHAADAMGNVHYVKGSNKANTTDFKNSTWCANCHHNVSNPGYNVTGLTPVPPLITIDNTGKTGWYNHAGDIASGYNDSVCNSCHGNGSVTSKQNVHDVTVGKGGGVNCTSCHNDVDGSAKKVNFTSVNKSMHANLNKNASSTGGNATNKPCWACHGTKNGSYANQSDQPTSGHNDTYKASARKCHDCHNDTSPLFNAKPVTDHIPYGLSSNTNVNTSKYNKTYCAYCHNNSIGAFIDSDGLGSNPMNASSAHYGANKTANKLTSATNNTTDCVYCHKNTSNMLKWGILPGSLSNISNKNGTLNTGFNHTLYSQSSGCYQCHGGAVANFHVPAMSPGEKGNPNCASCHNVSSPGSYAKVDFVAINISVHGSLNNKSSASAGNETNKPCWGCHGTKNGTYANQSDQPVNDHNTTYKSSPRKCEDCHINGSILFNAPGLTEHIMPGKNASTEINVTEGYCTVCHNNSITSNSDSDGLGLAGGSVINASTAHYAKDANANLMTTAQHSDNCTYCHFVNNGSSEWLTPRKPLTSTHSSYTNDTQPSTCWGCHVDYSKAAGPSTFHVQEVNKGTGSGPNCRSCHNTSDSGTTKGHIDGNVFDTSIHGGMNTTGGVDPNEPCWGCHGDGNQPASHPANYKNPYVCADCHVSTGARYSWAAARGALNVSEHFTSGSEIKASYNATALYSCMKCHQDIGEMRLNNSDNDYNITAWASGGDNYNSTIGGNNSPYHYGRKRGDLREGTNANCTYCHQNSSTAFESRMQNPTINKSINEHTNTGAGQRNITGRACTDSGCHNAGFIHNSTLTKPAVSNWTQGKYDYCAPCHRESGISTKKVRGHNTTNISTIGMDCGYCHNASSQGSAGSGALRIHSTKLTNKSAANTTCDTCHRDTTYVPASRVIKTHYPGTTTDKGNTAESGRTCELCHGEVAANKLHQPIIKKPAYDCQSCHLNGSKTSPYNATTGKASINLFQHDNATHAPTNQTNCERCHNNTNRPEIFHFTSWANGTSQVPGWAGWTNGTQVNCIDCHRNKTNQAPFYALFSSSSTHATATLDGCYNCHAGVPTYASNPRALHSVEQAPGNANCTLCHDIPGEASKKIDVAAMNKSDSIHINLNKNAAVIKAVQPYANDSKRCWACHGNGTEPGGHPANYKNAFKCADCHVPSGSRNTNYTPSNTILNVTEHYWNGSDIRTASTTYCTDCHNKTEMLKANSDTALSAVNPANDSVSHYGKNRSGMRSGANTSCLYCHQNSTTAFENVMLGISNKSIYEHTDAGTKNTSAGSCTGSKCHSQGLIHNSTLTKPAVSNWTQGSKDYCAPCHKVNDINATKYVFAHNTTNISAASMDCGYCHNASSQGTKSSGALKLHTSGITNTSTTNSTCAACHKDSKYVGASRVIRTHYPGAPAGKANTSLSTWDCEECHGWSQGTKMHTSGLIKKPNYDCNACHNASGGSSYKSSPSLFVNLTRHDNISLNGANVNCNTCHNNTNRLEPFHFTNWSNGTVEAPGWGSWINGTRANCTDCHVTYANQAPFYAEPSTYPTWHKGNYGGSLNDCYQCHSNLTVLNATDTRSPVEIHNVTRAIDWSNCNACHAPKYGGAPKVDNASLSALNSMHAGIDGATASNINPACKACHGGNASIHKNSSANNCTYCHITGKTGYGAKNVSEHILNGSYANTTVNTSRYQQVFCDLCHNNSLASFNDDSPGTKNATTAHYGQNKSAGKLMSGSSNTTDCLFCHKNSSNMAKWGVVSTSNANISNRGDHKDHSTNAVCYDCHVDSKTKPLTFHAEELNQGIGSSPNCMGCHNTGSSNKKIDFTVTNDSNSIHKNLNSGANAGSYDSANKPCWGCHGNGTGEGHNDTGDAYGKGKYKAPYNCTDCHISGDVRNAWATARGAFNVSEHYTNGADIKASYNATAVYSCLKCHQDVSEMLIQNNDPDAGSFDAEGDGVNGTNISAYHYGKKRTELRSGANTSCGYCHQNSSTAFGNVMLNSLNSSIYEHTNGTANVTNTTLSCTGSKCHATGFIHNSTLTKPKMQIWTAGQQDYCAPCHRAGDTNATKYVYSHNTSVTPINDDCGYCHNASSQGIAGSKVKIHTPNLTNATAPAVFANCAGCHNGTTLYVGAGKQILSHMPNASQYRGNTSTSSYDCKNCHNLSGKPSMHSTGMNRSNGTCNTCHFNRTSPYKSTKKIIASGDYNHTYVGQKTCAIAQCHNASNGSVFHMDKYAAGVVAEPEKFNSVWNDRYTMGFTESSYPYVDCIDCHRAPYNNSYPFNNTYPFNYSTNYSFNYEANHTGENKKVHISSDLIKSCYNCHTNRTDATDRYMVHNVTIEPLVGGPACTKCHNLSATSDATKRVNHTALNLSVHKNLTNLTAWNNSPNKATTVLLDSACWTCHATDINNIPGNEHPDRAGGMSKPFQCTECHVTGGYVGITNPQVYQNATKVSKHYSGAVLSGKKIHSTNFTEGSCQVCHNNSIETKKNLTDNINATVSHYVTKTDLSATNFDYGCEICHNNTATLYGKPKQLLNPSEHSMGGACQALCHNSNYKNATTIPVNSVILHNSSIAIYMSCYTPAGDGNCHTVRIR